ncbi:MAG: tRNA 5-methoxyuridine(34)/uridine 5-oxyacetic acid(34) synthase CmoB [Campylobacterota bacterium]|nr:tRNA 5-methoxyuridine(34)/uridine 5-oxyacetic acid(34) synthase CmoB [Campylobacterota bacterium]
MDLNSVRNERKKWMTWKNIAPICTALQSLPQIDSSLDLDDTVAIRSNAVVNEKQIRDIAKMMMPWRKGPFKIFSLFIDTEWQSQMKYNLLHPFFNLKNKRVADIGCNNGYYMFRMLEDNPASLVGFDPSPLYKLQFDLINHFAKTDIKYELLGVEHLPFYEEKFDAIFCLGVLYHRSDPVAMLKALYKGLDKQGEVILDTFMIDGEDEICLTPKSSYSKIPNIYFVPTIKALENWCKRAGFKGFETLCTSVTSTQEQRKTEWIDGESLENFLDPDDSSKTVEGYPAPKRIYVKLIKE